ncbi:MAG: Ig domain-containing protein, partial [Fibromonadaceae bacterium]|nr:Ig domain-containing protein [Fibromonadaceae bacterium]
MLFLPKKIKGALLCLLFLAPFAMAQAPQITYPSEANLEGTVGQYQSWQFESDQWDSGNEWSVVGTLPDGLWLNNYCWSGYCNIYGEPETAGTFSFTLRIENSNGPSTRTFTMEIKPPPPPQIAYPEESSLEVALGQYVDWGFESSDWREGSEWSVVGTLPDGLELSWWCQNSSSCYIYGEPETAGTFSFTLRIENSKGSSTRTFTLDVRIPNSPEIATASLPSGTMGEYYGEYLEASDFAKWRVESGALPDGLSLYTSGEIDGMPTKKGTYTFTVKAENVSGSSTKQFSITIDAEQQKPQI